MKNLLIFDFDGTILDSAPIIKRILNTLRAELNLLPLKVEDIYPWISKGGLTMITNCLCMSEEKAKDLLIEFRKIYLTMKTSECLLYEGVVEFLKFAKLNRFELAICSNKPEALLINALKDTNLESFFSAVVGDTNKTMAKPSPDRVFKILEKLGSNKKNAIMIGDSIIDYQTCYNADVDFIFFKGGYNDGMQTKNINHSFSYFSELAPIIKTAYGSNFDHIQN